MPWHVLDGAAHDDRTELRLGVSDSEATRAIWPHAFELELLVTVGATLELALITRNIDRAPFTISAALHSYLTVGDAGAIAIEGLDGHDYIDKVAGGARARQAGAVTLADETDRIYLDAPGSCTVIDPALSRRIEIAKAGSRTTVVWNPWAAKSATIRDMTADGYRTMVCVETANAADDLVTIAPGAAHELRAAFRLIHDDEAR
jgi:D-hexose-6-phosphate mutarotase